MKLTPPPSQTLVEVFNTDAAAQAAVRELKEMGFSDSQINIELHFEGANTSEGEHHHEGEQIGDFAMSGAAAGLGIGALWGLGILAGVAPEIYPTVIAAFPSAVLSTAAAGATVVGTSGALIGKLRHHDDESHQEHGCESGYAIVTVKAGTRAEIASRVLNHFNQNKCASSQAM